MALQLLTTEVTRKNCCPEPMMCSEGFTASLNMNDPVTLWKSTEPIKGTFFLRLNTGLTPPGTIAIFEIKQANGTIISRTVQRGTAYALTINQVIEVSVQVTNGPADQTALIEFRYCNLDTTNAESIGEKCCSPVLTCDELDIDIVQWTAEPLFTWETFFPVKGVLEFIFDSEFNPSDQPSATIEIERFNKPDIVRTIPLNGSTGNESELFFIISVDDINKLTVTSSEINSSNSFVQIRLCHQEENQISCCDQPLKCENSFFVNAIPPLQNLKIWESDMPVKGTYSITNFYLEALTVNIKFAHNNALQKTLLPGGGFAITSKDVKKITIRLNQSPTEAGEILFQYCVQDIPPRKSVCCPKSLHCDFLRVESLNNPQGQNIPIWLSKIPVDGEILFSIEGQPQQRAQVVIKRYGKPDITRTIAGERIFTVRTADIEGVFVQLNNGDPGDNAIRLVLCIQDQALDKDIGSESLDSKKTDCCPEPVRCETDANLLITNPVELPLNRDIVLWESTEPIKGTFSIRNVSETDADMTVKFRYKDGCIGTQTLKPNEGFMITDEGIISVNVRFSSQDPTARGLVDFESCTQNIIKHNKNNTCCPQPLFCQFLSVEAQNIENNQKYQLWHAGFPVKAMIEISLTAGESAEIIIERYDKKSITETIPVNVPRILVVDYIKNVYVKVHSESGTGSVITEICMQEQLPLKGDEKLCHCKY
jgi:hypothetical protein